MILVIMAVFMFPLYQDFDNKCCDTVSREVTEWGSRIVIKDQGVRGKISGIVLYSDLTPAESALVEVYIDETRTKEKNLRYSTQRLAACRTRAGGCFEFANIPVGRYEVRCSKDGFHTLSIIGVTIVSKARKPQKNMELHLFLGI